MNEKIKKKKINPTSCVFFNFHLESSAACGCFLFVIVCRFVLLLLVVVCRTSFRVAIAVAGCSIRVCINIFLSDCLFSILSIIFYSFFFSGLTNYLSLHSVVVTFISFRHIMNFFFKFFFFCVHFCFSCFHIRRQTKRSFDNNKKKKVKIGSEV